MIAKAVVTSHRVNTSASYASTADLTAVAELRARLQLRRESLAILRRRINTARASHRGGRDDTGRSQQSVSDISRRFMSAAAESENWKSSQRPFVTGGAGVGNLMSKWNKGFELSDDSAATSNSSRRPVVTGGAGVGNLLSKWNQVEHEAYKRAAVQARSIREAVPDSAASAHEGVSVEQPTAGSRAHAANNESITVVDDDVPSWAINQDKQVIQKENAKSKTGSVSVRDAQGNITGRGIAGVDISGFREESKKGKVTERLKMWGAKAADEAAREREETLRIESARARRAECEERNLMMAAKARKPNTITKIGEEEDCEFAESDDGEEEPTGIRDLMMYLERKCTRLEQKIGRAEKEIGKIGRQ